MQVIYKENMSTTVITNVASYQIGVDILGFPVYHEHYFAEEHISECSTKKQGKNMSKNKTILITNKYFNSNGNKEEKQPLTHYPQGNRTSNYYCKSNPQGSQEKQPPQVVHAPAL